MGKGFVLWKAWKKASVERVFGEKGREELERFCRGLMSWDFVGGPW